MKRYSPESHAHYLSGLSRGDRVYLRHGQDVTRMSVTKVSDREVSCDSVHFSVTNGVSRDGKSQIMYPTEQIVVQTKASERKRGIVSKIMQAFSDPGLSGRLMKMPMDDLHELMDIMRC